MINHGLGFSSDKWTLIRPDTKLIKRWMKFCFLNKWMYLGFIILIFLKNKINKENLPKVLMYLKYVLNKITKDLMYLKYVLPKITKVSNVLKTCLWTDTSGNFEVPLFSQVLQFRHLWTDGNGNFEAVVVFTRTGIHNLQQMTPNVRWSRWWTRFIM